MNTFKKIIRKIWSKTYGFTGDYNTWQDALSHSHGYDSHLIIERVRNSLLKVKSGEVAFERDSVTFDTIQYSWPLLAELLLVASKNKNQLNILDFGGSLGTSYFQNRSMLGHLHNLTWNIVEQPAFVSIGKKEFEDEHLKFHASISSILKNEKPNIFLAASSLQYIEHPYEILQEVIQAGVQHIIIERTPVWERPECITIQKVPPRIYNASYPARIFNSTIMKDIFLKNSYTFVAESDQGNMPYNGKHGSVKLKNYLLERR